ncbi:uncharacterized protein METZ01_LOCUS364941, partial [marine metagenome]
CQTSQSTISQTILILFFIRSVQNY